MDAKPVNARYGLLRSRRGPLGWLVRWRGLWWLRSGYCPCCYSSPPRSDCPVCRGDFRYGPDWQHSTGLTPERAGLWRARWLDDGRWDLMCDCSVHDITTPGAAHAVDCPAYD